MQRTLGRHMRHNVVAYIALFFAMGGTSAYAVNEWTGANIKDETLTGADVSGKAATSSTPLREGTLTGQDIRGSAGVNGSVSGVDIADNSVTGTDIRTDSVVSSDVASLTGTDVADDSLTGADVRGGSIGESDLAAGVGGPRAFAYVDPAGALPTATKRNVNAAKKESTGHYCLNVPFEPKSVLASIDGFVTPEPDVVVHPHAGSTFNCGEGWNIFVSVYDVAGPTAGYEDAGFNIWIE